MKTTNYLLSTLREDPKGAEIASHKLMIRAGLIFQSSSGIYQWLPTGTRVLSKVSNIVRKAMEKAGSVEIMMSMVQPSDLWHTSNRIDKYGKELLKFEDRHSNIFVLAPTHEEMVTTLAKQYIKSYKQFPINLFQIQSKFRDEIRPRFGIMRAREFLMKDAYSFHLNSDCLNTTYDKMRAAYESILHELELDYAVVIADSGSIGGQVSHEFQVLAESGEDRIAICKQSRYCANVELACGAPIVHRPLQYTQDINQEELKNISNVKDLSKACKVPLEKIVKTIFVEPKLDDHHKNIVALLIGADRELNELKVAKINEVPKPIRLAKPNVINAGIGGLDLSSLENITIIADHHLANTADFVIGSSKEGCYYKGANWKRDIPNFKFCDISTVKEGDLSLDGKGRIEIKRGIEVGHIFKLGSKYSDAFDFKCIDQSGKSSNVLMGCYGIGVARLLAAVIEQKHDEKGLVWPKAIAPFQVALIPIDYHKNEKVRQASDDLYYKLMDKGIEVILDDRKERFGVMRKDMEIIGIPNVIIISKNNVEMNKCEIEYRNPLNEKVECHLSDIDTICHVLS